MTSRQPFEIAYGISGEEIDELADRQWDKHRHRARDKKLLSVQLGRFLLTREEDAQILTSPIA